MSLVEGMPRRGVRGDACCLIRGAEVVSDWCSIRDRGGGEMSRLEYDKRRLRLVCFICLFSVMTCLRFTSGRACERERGAGEFGASSTEFCGVNDPAIPFQSWRLLHQCAPTGECSVWPLGNVKIVDHLARGTAGAMFAIAVAGSAEAEGGVGFVDGWHHLV